MYFGRTHPKMEMRGGILNVLTSFNVLTQVATCSATDHSFKQMPAPVNHLMKDFYFFPGLFETTEVFEDDEKEEKMDGAPDTKGIDQHDSRIHGQGHAPGSGGCGQCGGKGRGRKNENSDFPRYSTL